MLSLYEYESIIRITDITARTPTTLQRSFVSFEPPLDSIFDIREIKKIIYNK